MVKPPDLTLNTQGQHTRSTHKVSAGKAVPSTGSRKNRRRKVGQQEPQESCKLNRKQGPFKRGASPGVETTRPQHRSADGGYGSNPGPSTPQAEASAPRHAASPQRPPPCTCSEPQRSNTSAFFNPCSPLTSQIPEKMNSEFSWHQNKHTSWETRAQNLNNYSCDMEKSKKVLECAKSCGGGLWWG